MHVLAKFIGGADKVERLPKSNLSEVAFLGRSNVGKSTFINRLVNQRDLARASNTPGRTQEVNLFQVEVHDKKAKIAQLVLADLPGFGYAKLSKAKRESLHSLILSYLESRKDLSLLCLLNDIRRDPGEEEIFIRDSAFNLGIPVMIVLTKGDKLSYSGQRSAIQKISKSYGLDPADVLLSGDKISAREAWSRILPLLSK